MVRIMSVLEIIYICAALMFFSKELINSDESSRGKDLRGCGISI